VAAMTNVHTLPNSDQCFDEASEWIAKFDRGLDKEEEHAFQSWISLNKQNRDTFTSMAKMWDKMDDLSRLSDLFPEPANVHTKKPQRALAGMAIAASVLVAVFSLNYLLTATLPSTQMSEYRAGEVYETTIGEHSSVTLPDGSVLVLNTDSLASVEFNEVHRLITLERGEIHIDVAHDKKRPLSIRAGDKVVQAVGTAFNIELYDDNKFELIVTEGEVRISDRDVFENRLRKLESSQNSIEESQKLVRLSSSSMSVSQGEKMMVGFPVIEPPVMVALDEIKQDLSWRSGNLVFTGETLAFAIEEISRYTPVEFIIEDEDLKNVRVAGLFRAGDVNGLLSALSESFDIDSVKVSKDKVRLVKGE